MNRDHQYWAVKVEDCIILLPRGGDDSFYEEAEVFKNNGHGTISGPVWFPVKFGRVPCAGLTLRKEVEMKDTIKTDTLFGQEGKIMHDNGNEWSFVVADHHGSVITLLKLPSEKSE